MTTFNNDPERANHSKPRRRFHRRLRWVQIASLIIAFAAALFVWWVAGLKIEAADSFTTEPPITQWGGTAIVVFLFSMLTALGAGVAIFIRSKK